jgi:polyisoprenoid-binding protein YceI
MQKLLLIAGFAGILLACGETNQQAEQIETAEIESTTEGDALRIAADSQIRWTGKKLTGEHYGTLNISEGNFYMTDGQLTGGKLVIDMTSIKVLDLTDAGKNADLTDHLKSDDFFSVEKFNTATFEIAGITPMDSVDANGNNVLVSGNLSIKGITQGIKFPAQVEITNGQLTAAADFTIDRTLWDIRYRSGKFFPELGDKAISDEIGIQFSLTASAE